VPPQQHSPSTRSDYGERNIPHLWFEVRAKLVAGVHAPCAGILENSRAIYEASAQKALHTSLARKTFSCVKKKSQ
jgi:hypothetical protein